MDAELLDNVLFGMDIVIHLAWSFSDDPRVVFAEDIKRHVNLLEAASSSKVSHFIYASTATVYGRAVDHPVTIFRFWWAGAKSRVRVRNERDARRSP